MSNRACYKCGVTKDLRPYGPGGKDTCFPCMKATPGAEDEAKRQLGQRFLTPGPLLLDDSEQVGPRPLVKKTKNNTQ